MKIAFTICSNNYLAQALVLRESLLKHNPDYKFYICLVDKRIDKISYPENTIEAATLQIPGFDQMVLEYNIIELNTAVKPFFIRKVFQIEPVSFIFYFDPDIKIFSSLSPLEIVFNEKSISLTPHALTPLPMDGLMPMENIFLNHGIYNLGFIGVRNIPEIVSFLNWWCDRLETKCIIDLKEGYFVDQLWINLVPIYFYNLVHIFLHTGLNTAYWNLHERKISNINGIYYVNSEVPLIFFHFSGYNPNKPEFVAKNQNRISFESHPEIIKLFNDYRDDLLEQNYNFYCVQKPFYTLEREKYLKMKELKKRSTIRGFLRFTISLIANRIRTIIN
jgi:hypothetical protein